MDGLVGWKWRRYKCDQKNPKLTEEENEKIIDARQKAFLKKYESWIKKNRIFIIKIKQFYSLG